jgi:hypothetical protein
VTTATRSEALPDIPTVGVRPLRPVEGVIAWVPGIPSRYDTAGRDHRRSG